MPIVPGKLTHTPGRPEEPVDDDHGTGFTVLLNHCARACRASAAVLAWNDGSGMRLRHAVGLREGEDLANLLLRCAQAAPATLADPLPRAACGRRLQRVFCAPVRSSTDESGVLAVLDFGEEADGPPTALESARRDVLAAFADQAAALRALQRRLHEAEKRLVERDRTIARLEQRAGHLALAQSIARVGSWEYRDSDGRLYWSEETARLFGLPAEPTALRLADFIGRVHPDDRRRMRRVQKRALAGDGNYEVSYRVVLPDGGIRHLHERCLSMRSGADGVHRVAGTVHDITEHVEAENERRALLASEMQARREAEAARASFSALFEHAPGLYLVLSAPDYRIVAVSNAYLEATMTRRESIVGRHVREVFPDAPGDPDANGLAALSASLGRVCRTGQSDVMAIQRYPIPRPEPLGGGFETRYWSVVNTPVPGRDGTVAYVIHRVEDVTALTDQGERSGDAAPSPTRTPAGDGGIASEVILQAGEIFRMNRRIRSSERRYRRLLADAPVGIVTLSANGRIGEANRAFCTLIGRDEAELPPIELASVLPEAVRGPIVDELVQLASGKSERYSTDTPILRADGSQAWVRLTLTAVSEDDGESGELIAIVEDIDARKLAEEGLRRSEQLLKIAGRTASLGGWVWERGSDRIVWSDEAAAIHGEPAGTHPTLRRVVEYYTPEWRGAIEAAFVACARNGTLFDGEFEIVRADGIAAWVRSTGEAVRNEEGIVVRIQGACQDITHRRAAERALRDSEARFRAVALASTDVIWDYDFETRTVWWNQGIETILGYRREEPVATTRWWTSRIHPDDRNRVLETVRDAIAARKASLHGEYRFLRADDSVATIEDRVVVLYDDAGEPRRMIGGMTDVTDARRRNAQLAQQAALLDAARDAIVVRDFKRGVVYWNRGAERLYGWSAAQMLGQPLLPMIYQDQREYETVCRRVAEDGQWSGELHQKRSDGTPLTIESSWSLVFDAEGQPTGIIAISTDATARKSLELQLHQAQRLESVGLLSGGIAHDFNNLLTVIVGNAELLGEEIAQQPALESLLPTVEMVLSAAQRGAELTRQLLAFSSRQPLTPQAVSIEDTLRATDSLLRRALTSAVEVDLAETAGDARWLAFADRVQLEAAILNLCVNARDAMPAGGRLRLAVEHRRIADGDGATGTSLSPGDYVVLVVSDTGQGIPPEHLERVFDPFFTTKETGKGTGLGLSIVYGFARQSGGRVAIESSVGRGTTVRLWLPRAGEAGPAPDVSLAEQEVPRGTEAVLVVEDDPLVQAHARRLLTALGYKVTCANDALQALDYLRGDLPVDLLFTDIVMPGGIDGRQLGRQARTLRPGIAVLYTSGYAKSSIEDTLQDDARVILLPKPYRKPELAGMVRAALRAARP